MGMVPSLVVICKVLALSQGKTVASNHYDLRRVCQAAGKSYFLCNIVLSVANCLLFLCPLSIQFVSLEIRTATYTNIVILLSKCFVLPFLTTGTPAPVSYTHLRAHET